MMSAYYRRLTGADENVRNKAAAAWTKWECSTSRLLVDADMVKKASDDAWAYAFARIEWYVSTADAPIRSAEQALKKNHASTRTLATTLCTAAGSRATASSSRTPARLKTSPPPSSRAYASRPALPRSVFKSNAWVGGWVGRDSATTWCARPRLRGSCKRYGARTLSTTITLSAHPFRAVRERNHSV